MEAGTLREWLVKPGDVVKRGDIIAEVETQKGLIEIEVFNDGKIENLLVGVNVKVPVGTLLALINPDGEAAVKPAMPTIKPASETAVGISPPIEKKRVRITPLARKIAEENKIDYSVIKGSGEDGTIVKEDIEKAILEQTSQGEIKPGIKTNAAKVRTAIAAAMSRSNKEIPHYYLTMRIDMSESLTWLAEKNKQLPAPRRILYVAVRPLQ